MARCSMVLLSIGRTTDRPWQESHRTRLWLHSQLLCNLEGLARAPPPRPLHVRNWFLEKTLLRWRESLHDQHNLSHHPTHFPDFLHPAPRQWPQGQHRYQQPIGGKDDYDVQWNTVRMRPGDTHAKRQITHEQSLKGVQVKKVSGWGGRWSSRHSHIPVTICKPQSLTSVRIKDCTLRVPNKTTILFLSEQ